MPALEERLLKIESRLKNSEEKQEKITSFLNKFNGIINIDVRKTESGKIQLRDIRDIKDEQKGKN